MCGFLANLWPFHIYMHSNLLFWHCILLMLICSLTEISDLFTFWKSPERRKGWTFLNCICAPILVQGFEAYVGQSLLRTAFVGVVSEWQVQVCSCLLFYFILYTKSWLGTHANVSVSVDKICYGAGCLIDTYRWNKWIFQLPLVDRGRCACKGIVPTGTCIH